VAESKRDAEFTEYALAKTPWLRRVAHLMCQDWHRADDLVQNTLTKLYVQWPRVRGVEFPDAYARAVLVNEFLAEQRSPWWRRVTVRRELIDMEALETRNPGNGPADPGAAADTGLDLGAALAAVPPRQRAALVLRFYCDLSVQETAEILGCSSGTVKSQTARGLTALRTFLEARSVA
jgi:RNA polymerase sigma-70 factor (sigma-E family)